MPTKTVSALSDEDVRRKYYESAGHSMWITEMQLDPLQLIVCDDGSGKYFQVPIALKGGEIQFGSPVEVAVQYVPAGKQAMSVVWASRADSLSGITAPPEPSTRPDALTQMQTAAQIKAQGGTATPAQAAVMNAAATTTTSTGSTITVAPDVTPAGAAIRKMAAATQAPSTTQVSGSASTTEQEASGMPIDAAKLKEALGLPADASGDDALTALAAALSPATSGAGSTNPAPVTVPQLVDGNRPILLDPSQLSALQDSARKGEVAWAQLRRNERDGVLDEAIKLGKFPAARRDYWVQLWDRDPDGTREAVNALAANVIPVLSPGYLGDDSAHRSAAEQAYAGLFGEER